MANKLSWNPPKWKSYSLDGNKFEVELETGEVYKGSLNIDYIIMNPDHNDICHRIFGITFGTNKSADALRELSNVLDLALRSGVWPEYYDIREFLKRYYERVAKIGNSSISKICIETELDITPKFTI